MDASEPKDNIGERERRFDMELLKKGLRCDLDQYDMLKRCSDKKDMTEWNEWRKQNPEEDILLECADFSQGYLNGALLNAGGFKNIDTGEFTEFHGEVHLKGAFFDQSHLQDVDFIGAYLAGATLYRAHLENADFRLADLRDAILWEADLRGANLNYAHLESVGFDQLHGEEAGFEEAHLEGAVFYEAHLEGACFLNAIVDGSTLFWKCHADRNTDFRGVALDSASIDPATKQLLEYNIRRMNWEDWYEKHPKLKWLVKPFWLTSDYGLSTGRIIVAFFALAFIFANIYYHWGRVAPPGIVDNLFIDRNGIEVAWWLVPLRTLYFSIVTMTTLGFGDMYANAHSIWGHILLSVQVILGYVLLAALVTRFAVLFTAGGPAGRFANEQKEKDKT
jgi:uncharacterized protein YjbI with pentapeptide repeats